MKFCPHCGAQLDDSARFCARCGARQPELTSGGPAGTPSTSAPLASVPTPPTSPTPTPAAPSAETPAAKFNRLASTDPKFLALYKTFKKLNLLRFFTFLFIPVLIVYLAVPCAIFTGENMGGGADILRIAGIYPLPAQVNICQLGAAKNAISYTNYSFSPSSWFTSNVTTGILLPVLLCVFLVPITVLSAVLGVTKSWYLKSWEKDGGSEIIASMTRSGMVVTNCVGIIFPLIYCIFVYASAKDLVYDYSEDPAHYIYGEITALPNNMIATLVVGGIMLAATIALTIVFRILILKKVRSYLS